MSSSGLYPNQQTFYVLPVPWPYCPTIRATVYSCVRSPDRSSSDVTDCHSDVFFAVSPFPGVTCDVRQTRCTDNVLWIPFSSTTVVFGCTSTIVYRPIFRCCSLLQLDVAVLSAIGGPSVKGDLSIKAHWSMANLGLVGTLAP